MHMFSNILSINPIKEESPCSRANDSPPPPPPLKSKDHVELRREKKLCSHSNYETDLAKLESCFCSTNNKQWVRMFEMKFEI